MFRDRNEELDRLESALLEQDEPAEEEEFFEEEEDTLYDEEFDDCEEIMDQPTAVIPNVRAYTNSHTDVELDQFSRQVEKGKKKGGFGIIAFLMVLLTGAFCVLAYLVLKQGGYLP